MPIFLLEENILLISIRFMKNFSFRYAFAAFFCFAASLAFAQNPVRIVGSDIVGDKISKEILAQSNLIGSKCVVEMNGSRDGLNDLKAGKADIAIVAILDSDQFPEGFAAVPFAHQIATIPHQPPKRQSFLNDSLHQRFKTLSFLNIFHHQVLFGSHLEKASFLIF